mmetsp:Transcript_22273/g.62059  ORF Transcript_22273/g.62059 Transcript_22273/m.62059 type:complete len:82 (+) Transcript_22273:3310-3555(+)
MSRFFANTIPMKEKPDADDEARCNPEFRDLRIGIRSNGDAAMSLDTRPNIPKASHGPNEHNSSSLRRPKITLSAQKTNRPQ